MIQEEYVTFEQAKALKELRFPQEWTKHPKSTIWLTEHRNEYHPREVDMEGYACPTLSLVQKWLREEKDLHIFTIHYISRSNNTEWYSCEIDSKNFDKAIRIDNEENGGCFDKYEDALSAGIDKCIELLRNG